jgi:hypothetical protein
MSTSTVLKGASFAYPKPNVPYATKLPTGNSTTIPKNAFLQLPPEKTAE